MPHPTKEQIAWQRLNCVRKQRSVGWLRAASRCVIIAPIMARTLLDKVWEGHTVRALPSGQTQLVFGQHRKLVRVLLTLKRTAEP